MLVKGMNSCANTLGHYKQCIAYTYTNKKQQNYVNCTIGII